MSNFTVSWGVCVQAWLLLVQVRYTLFNIWDQDYTIVFQWGSFSFPNVHFIQGISNQSLIQVLLGSVETISLLV